MTSSAATVEHYELFDVNGRLVRAFNVNSDRFTIDRNGIEGGCTCSTALREERRIATPGA